MQSAFLIAIENKNAHSPNREKWVYASESFLGKLSFIPWDKKGKGILKFKTEEDARNWWEKNKDRFDLDEVNKQTEPNNLYIIKKIWPDDKDRRRATCRIIKPM